MAEMIRTNPTVPQTVMTPAQEYRSLSLRDRAFIQTGGFLKNAGEFVETHCVTAKGKAWLAQRSTMRMEHLIGDIVARKVAEVLGKE